MVVTLIGNSCSSLLDMKPSFCNTKAAVQSAVESDIKVCSRCFKCYNQHFLISLRTHATVGLALVQ